jgi:hypothetical protein
MVRVARRWFPGGDVKEYLVVVHHAEEGGYWAEVPALDGCFAQGETVEEAPRRMHEGRLHRISRPCATMVNRSLARAVS